MHILVWAFVTILHFTCPHAKILPKQDCSPTFVDCSCNNGDMGYTVQIYINTTFVPEGKSGRRKCSAVEDPVLVCEKQNCTIYPNDNFDALFASGIKLPNSNYLDDMENYDSSNETFYDNILDAQDSSSFYPIEYTVPRRKPGEMMRYKRQRGSCVLPRFENAFVTCWKWPNWQSCRVRCSYAHAMLMQGSRATSTSNSFSCRNTESNWKPFQPRDCQPYMHCKARLVNPGDLRCQSTGSSPSFCEISCMDYDNRRATGRRRIECDRQFRRNLPHCAQLDISGSGQLIAFPSESMQG